jgi:hypothetical protein
VPQIDLYFLAQFVSNVSHRGLEVSGQEAISDGCLDSGVGDGNRWGSEGGQSKCRDGGISDRELSCELVFLERSYIDRESKLVVRTLAFHRLNIIKKYRRISNNF